MLVEMKFCLWTSCFELYKSFQIISLSEIFEALSVIDNFSKYCIYLVIRQGFPLSRKTTNNQISPLKFCYNTSFSLSKQPKDLDPSYRMDIDF